MNRGPATWATVVALALINVGLATAIVAALGTATFAPMWVGLALVVLGLVGGVLAISLWRHYLLELREH
ncbi:MAG: hypothetical protein JOZ87_29805 [Chloroflexi bacterium]|nr:hypothetical protein [Chloroflexota bacterium]